MAKFTENQIVDLYLTRWYARDLANEFIGKISCDGLKIYKEVKVPRRASPDLVPRTVKILVPNPYAVNANG